MKKRHYLIPAFLLAGAIGISTFWDTDSEEGRVAKQEYTPAQYSPKQEEKPRTRDTQKGSLESKVKASKTNERALNSQGKNPMSVTPAVNERFSLGYKPEEKREANDFELETSEILGQDCTGRCIYTRDANGNIQKTEDSLNGRIDFVADGEDYILDCKAKSYWILIDENGGLQSFGISEEDLRAKDVCRFEEADKTYRFNKIWEQ